MSPLRTILLAFLAVPAQASEGMTKLEVLSCSASSQFNPAHACGAAVDGDDLTEWASKGEGVGAWIQLNFDEPQAVSLLKYANRLGNEKFKKMQVSFSDGSSIDVTLHDDAQLHEYPLGQVVTSFVKLTCLSAYSTVNNGAQEIEVWGKAATCVDTDGLGGAVQDADCGTGMVSSKNATICSKSPCEITGDKADFDKCCRAATCGDPTGKDSGAVNNTECGDGYVYAASQSATVCSMGPCEISTGSKADRGKCCKAVCESAACGSGSMLKPTSASLTCASFNCSLSDQSTCCDLTCKVPKVVHGAVSGAGCIAEATVVHGMTCTVKAEAAGYECDATSMSCVSGNMTAPVCKLSEKDDGNDDGKQDGRQGVKEYEYKGSVSVTAGAANTSQVEAAMRSALAKHFGCDESKVVITIKEESSTVLMVSFTIVLSSDAAKSTKAKMNALDKDMSGLNGDFIKQLKAAGVDTTNTKTSSFTMKKVDNAALISTGPTPVLGSATILAALWTMLG